VVAVFRVHSLAGREHPCGGGCGRAGWLQHSLDGRYVFVGDAGDVIDTRRRTVVAYLPALDNSRYQLELDWRNGKPVRTSARSGIGYPRSRTSRAPSDRTSTTSFAFARTSRQTA
jgi:hypothetical protein